MFNFGKNFWVKAHAKHLVLMVDCQLGDATKFIEGNPLFELVWQVDKRTGEKKNPDIQSNINIAIEGLLDFSQEEYDATMGGSGLDKLTTRLLTAKAAATIIKQNLLTASNADPEKFKVAFMAFCEQKLNPYGTGWVTLFELMENPKAGLPISEHAAKVLFGD